MVDFRHMAHKTYGHRPINFLEENLVNTNKTIKNRAQGARYTLVSKMLDLYALVTASNH